MPNYSFYDAFSPIDFERFSRDVVQIREDIPFEISKKGKDKGIDFYHKSHGLYIVGQAKSYKKFSDFFRVLKHQELKKVKRLRPTRYIITTSLSLTNSEIKEILDLFEGYLHSGRDVLGKDELNDLLGEEAYHKVEKKYNKLWITSSNVLQYLLDETVYRAQYNLIKDELEKIQSVSRYYVQNKSFDEGLQILTSNRYLIISGTAGSGKTTLARMLVSCFLNDEFELVLISRDVNEAWNLYKEQKKQIFFFDDFLGSFQFDESVGGGRNLVDLNRFCDKIQRTTNKLLILTTREYILRRGQIKYKDQLDDGRVDISKCIVDASKYTKYERAEILFNHLYFSGMDLGYISYFGTMKGDLEQILNHPNYTPRLVEDFTNKVFSDSESGWTGGLSRQLKKYLDDPYSFWESLFEKLDKSAQLVLLIIFSSCEPVDINALKKTFDNVVREYLKVYNDLILSPDSFGYAIKELMDSFISISEFSYSQIVGFQNPSINDFLLKFLPHKNKFTEILICGSTYWNQLIFIYTSRTDTTKFGESRDELDGAYISGEKINLSEKLTKIWVEKVIRDFDNLYLCNIEEKGFTSDYSVYNSIDDLQITKLRDILVHLDIEIYHDAKVFILNRVNSIIQSLIKEDSNHNLPLKAFQELPYLISSMREQIEFPALEVIQAYYSQTFDCLHYYGFKYFGKIYPSAFESFFNDNKKEIRSRIRAIILDDLLYYDFDEPEEGHKIDVILETHAGGIFEEFGMRMTKSFIRKMEEAAFDGMSRKEYIEEYGLRDQIRDSIKKDRELRELANQEREKENINIQSLFSDVDRYVEEVDILVDFKKRARETICVYTGRALHHFLNSDNDELRKNLAELSFNTFRDSKNHFNLNYFKDNFKGYAPADVSSALEALNPILLESHHRIFWGSKSIRDFLAVSHILRMSKIEDNFLNEEYRNILYRSPEEHATYWPMWESLDRQTFIKKFAFPKWEEVYSSLDFSSEIRLVESFIGSTDYTIDVRYDEKTNTIEYSGGSGGGGGILWFLLQHFDRYDLFDVPVWFFSSDDYQDSEEDSSIYPFHLIKRSLHDKLIEYIKSNYECHDYQPFITLEESPDNSFSQEYSIPFGKELKNPMFLELMKDVGLIRTIEGAIEDTNRFFHAQLTKPE